MYGQNVFSVIKVHMACLDVKKRIDIEYLKSGPGPTDDNTPPVITMCPRNAISVTALAGSSSATASWTEPTATDDSGVVPTRSRSHAPGQVFPVGTTLVTYRFTDRSGNSDTCQFQVVVVESRWYFYLQSLITTFNVTVIAFPMRKQKL